MPESLPLDPLLGASEEVRSAVIITELRNLKEAVLARLDTTDAQLRSFMETARGWVDHETANRKLADEGLKAMIDSVDRKKTVEQPQLDSITSKLDGAQIADTKHDARLTVVEDDLKARRVVQRCLIAAVSGIGGGLTLLFAALQSGLLHH